MIVAVASAAWVHAGDEPSTAGGATEKGIATVEDLAWIAGDWHGEIFGGPIQEMWSSPMGGSMTGLSRMGADAKKTVYESLLIEATDGVPTMYLRHFGPKLKAREGGDAMAYSLVSHKSKSAVFKTQDTKLGFQEISYQREGDVLTVKLIGQRQGKPMTVTSTMKLANGR